MQVQREVLKYLIAGLALTAFAHVPHTQQPPAPQLTLIEPNSASTTPGTKIMVFGTHLSPDSAVYFGGFQARETNFINSSTLQVLTPYLRPGSYKLQLRSDGATIRSKVGFTALPTPIDSEIDSAEALASQRQTSEAIGTLNNIAKTCADYQVRAYAYYRMAQIYLRQGEYWRAAGAAAEIWDAKAGISIQTPWQYRVLDEQSTYYLSESNDHETDLRVADWTVEKDVTENPEPRFWRALLNARFGNTKKAEADLKFILAAEPDNPSYLALAAYIAALGGVKTQLETLQGQTPSDPRALSLLGQAAYLAGDYTAARNWWAAEAKISTVGAKLDYWAGRKHLKYGQTRVAAALLAECSTVVPNSKEGKEAKELLVNLGASAP